MEFEFTIAITHSIVFIIYALKKSMKFKTALLFLLFTQYGPIYALLKFTSLISFNLVASLIIILLTINKRSNFNYKIVILFVFIPLITHTIGSLMFGFDLFSFSKGVLSLCIIYSAILAARYFISMGVLEFFRTISISYTMLAIIVVITRFFYEESLRDAGIPLIMVGFFVWAVIEKRYFAITLLGTYLATIQTRSVLLLIVFMLFFYRKELFKSYGRLTSVILSLPVFGYIVLVIYERTFLEDLDVLSGSITRLNAIKYEIDIFLNYPIFGAGMFYYDSFWKELLSDQLALISGVEEYIAFNHIGYISLVAQSGIIGLITFIILPIRWLLKSKKYFGLDKLIKGILIIYLLSFFMSGSPIRTDFPDMFYYFFIVFLFHNRYLKKKLKDSSLS